MNIEQTQLSNLQAYNNPRQVDMPFKSINQSIGDSFYFLLHEYNL